MMRMVKAIWLSGDLAMMRWMISRQAVNTDTKSINRKSVASSIRKGRKSMEYVEQNIKKRQVLVALIVYKTMGGRVLLLHCTPLHFAWRSLS